MENRNAKTPDVDLMESALKHYNEASSTIHHFDSGVPRAIKFYYRNKSKWYVKLMIKLNLLTF